MTTKFLWVALVATIAVGCNQKQTVNVLTSPTTSPPATASGVTEVLVSTPTVSITLNACPASIGFTATVHGDNLTDTSVSWEKTGGGSFTSTGATSATLEINAAGTYIVTARSKQDTTKSGTVTVTATGNCPSGPTTPTTPTTPTPAPTCSLSASPTSVAPGGTTTLSLSHGNTTSVETSWAGTVPVTFSPSVWGSISLSSTTTYRATCTGPGGSVPTSATVTVVTTPTPTPTGLSINVQPKTVSCGVGGQANLGAAVTAASGVSTAVTWEVSDASVMTLLRTNQNEATFSCLKVGSVTITARAVADTSKSDQATGTVTNGTITCTWTTSTGLQADGTVRIARNQSIAATGNCSNGSGALLPAWFSSDPARVGVRGDSKTTINGLIFETGNTATITGIFGSTSVCVQAAIDRTSPSFCRTVTVQ